MSFKDNYGGNAGKRNYFKPEDYENAYVLMIEVEKFDPEAPNRFAVKPDDPTDEMYPLLLKQYEEKKFRPELTATITVFQTPEHLDQGIATELPHAVINYTYLAQDLQRSVGKIEVQRLGKGKPGKSGKPPWQWKAVEGTVVDKVGAYYDAREAALKKALEADDTPAYLKG